MTAMSRLKIAHGLVLAGATIAAGADDRVVVTCSRGPVPAGLRAELEEREAEIVAWLRSLPSDCRAPVLCMALGACPRARAGVPCSTAPENICSEHPIDAKEVA